MYIIFCPWIYRPRNSFQLMADIERFQHFQWSFVSLYNVSAIRLFWIGLCGAFVLVKLTIATAIWSE